MANFTLMAGRAAIAAAAVCWACVLQAPAAEAADLFMFESKGCGACRMFDAEIAPDYDRSAFGRTYPLRRVDMQTGSIDFTLKQPVTMTPTFVFVEAGAEIARFTGYPGRNHFYDVMERTIGEVQREKMPVPDLPKQAMNDFGRAPASP